MTITQRRIQNEAFRTQPTTPVAPARHSTFCIQHSPRAAFTLIEVIVVLSIIVVLGLTAVPAIRFITGSRSTDSATNMASAMLGRARSQAILDQQYRGVFFFLDPVSDRTTMALVKQEGDKTPDPDFDAYKGWTDGKFGAGYSDPPAYTNIPSYYDETNTLGPSFTVALAGNVPGEGYANYSRQILEHYKCIKSNTPAVGNQAGLPYNGNTYWGLSASAFLEILDYTDFQTLPPGVGAQLIHDPHGQGSTDRYVRTGVILFDGNGRFDSVPWGIKGKSRLAAAIGLTAANLNPDLTNTATYTGTPRLFSEFGLVLYDRQTFKAAGPGTENDWIFRNFFPTPVPASFAAEQTEETWIDSNTTPLPINRYNGTLIKGE